MKKSVRELEMGTPRKKWKKKKEKRKEATDWTPE